MLEPYFFQRWRRDEQGNFVPVSTLSSEVTFRVTGYAQVEEYTLVSWRFGREDEYATGENLYRDRTLIATGGGSLPLYEPKIPPEKSQTPPPEEQGVLSRVNNSIGQYGVPPAVAVALRDPLNYVAFENDD